MELKLIELDKKILSSDEECYQIKFKKITNLWFKISASKYTLPGGFSLHCISFLKISRHFYSFTESKIPIIKECD